MRRWHLWRARRIAARIAYLQGYPEGLDLSTAWRLDVLRLNLGYHLGYHLSAAHYLSALLPPS